MSGGKFTGTGELRYWDTGTVLISGGEFSGDITLFNAVDYAVIIGPAVIFSGRVRFAWGASYGDWLVPEGGGGGGSGVLSGIIVQE
jgi:hypothetical protein